MQSQYKYRAKYIEAAIDSNSVSMGTDYDGVRNMNSQINDLAADQFRGVNEKIESLIPIMTSTPNLLVEVSDSVLSILIFDFLLKSIDSNIEKEIFEFWDEYYSFKRLTFYDVQKILQSSGSYTQFIESLCEIYAMNVNNMIDSYQLICQIRVYLSKFLKLHEFSRTTPSKRCEQIEEVLFSLENFIVTYREARDEFFPANFIEP